MPKKIIPLFFAFIFLMMITAPTIISIIDKDSDVIVMIGQNEEEEKGENKLKDIEIKLIKVEQQSDQSSFISKNKLNEFYFKEYTRPIISLVLPPPQFITI